MPTRKLTFLAGGSVAALILGLGMASLALAPVRDALKTAPMRGPPPGAFQTPAPTALGSPSAPIEVASLAGRRLPVISAAPLDASPALSPDAQVASSDQPQVTPDSGSSSDDGPRTVAAPPDQLDTPPPWRSPYWRHREPRPRAEEAPRFLPAPPPALEYPQDPN